MVSQVGWHEGNKPPQDGVYLVRITLEDSFELGFGKHPPILVANYKKQGNEWAVHGAIIPIQNFGENIISWHELPPL